MSIEKILDKINAANIPPEKDKIKRIIEYNLSSSESKFVQGVFII